MGTAETVGVGPMEPGSEPTTGTKVSILMAVHGVPTWLFEALDSLSRQTFDAWEFRCVLDGPNSPAERILTAFGDRFQYEVVPFPVGPAEARNHALRAATGELVAVLDSDDVWPEDHLAEHVAAMTNDRELVLRGTSAELIDEEGKRTGDSRRVPDRDLPRRLLSRNAFVHSSTIYRRLPALSVGGYDPSIRVGEDLHLWLRLAQIGKIANDPSRSIDYRIHSFQTSRQSIDAYSTAQIGHERSLLAKHIGVGRARAWALDRAWRISQRLH